MFTNLEQINNHYDFNDKLLIDKLLKNGIHQYKIKDYCRMKEYYQMAINKGNSNAMNNLGVYYEAVEKDYDKMKQYYQMAVSKGNSSAMCNLGNYYKKVEKDYQQMKKYYGMAIDAGNSSAMYNLGNYYKEVEKDYQLMVKYYIMAIDAGSSNAMCNLGNYYQNVEKDYQLMVKYYRMAIDAGNSYAMIKLYNYYTDKFEFYKELEKIPNKNDLILNKINELEKLKQIQFYKNKIRLFTQLNNYKQCGLCLEENVLNIDLICGHEICIDCYSPDAKCVFNYCCNYC